MKRQTKTQGVVARWVATPFSIAPFTLPVKYKLRQTGVLNRLFHIETVITVTSRSVLIERRSFNRLISFKRLSLSEFSGIAMRFSVQDGTAGDFIVSINLHHEQEEFCIPLFLAYDLSVAGARIQTWSRVLRLPVLLPAADGGWKEPFNRLGRLKVRAPVQRFPRRCMYKRKALLPAYREVGKVDPDKKVGGREMFARR